MRKSKMLKLDKKLRPWLKYYGDVPANMEYPNFSMVDLIIEAAEKYPNNEFIQSKLIKYGIFILW